MVRHQKRIKKELVSFTVSCMVGIICLLSAGSVYLTWKTTRNTLAESFQETSELVSEKITQQLKEYSIISESIALYHKGNAKRDGNISIFLTISSSQYGLNGIDIISEKGISQVSGKSYAQDPVFLLAKDGKPHVSDPIIKKDQVSFEYIYPYGDLMVVLEFPYSVFENIVSETKIGKTGSTYLLNRNGTKVACDDFSLVLEGQNSWEDAKKNPSVYKEVAQLESAMMKGESGFGYYDWGGVNKFGSYTPIENTDGWSVNVTASESEFMSGVKTAVIASVILGLVSVLLGVLAVLKIAGKITKPIGEVVDSIEKLSGGDLNITVKIERRDEIGGIAEKINEMAENYRSIIMDISHFLKEISCGNLAVKSSCEYPGEFNGIRTSMEEIALRLNGTVRNIRTYAEQVDKGAGQLSTAAVDLAEGTGEQANAVEELNLAVRNVSEQTEKNAVHVRNANDYVNQSAAMVSAGSQYMESLRKAMEEVSISSEKIAGITRLIEDIAFQTNILALNAAVEAARAGSAGRGFAVVADEVRNLAAKSAAAAKQTSELIGQSGVAVMEGHGLMRETVGIFKEIAQKSVRVEQTVGEISAASMTQAQAMEQIHQGLSKVYSVVQANAATAEESSASSEELAGLAHTLKKEVAKFNLKTDEP